MSAWFERSLKESLPIFLRSIDNEHKFHYYIHNGEYVFYMLPWGEAHAIDLFAVPEDELKLDPGNLIVAGIKKALSGIRDFQRLAEAL